MKSTGPTGQPHVQESIRRKLTDGSRFPSEFFGQASESKVFQSMEHGWRGGDGLIVRTGEQA